jgi:hypothetical protein
MVVLFTNNKKGTIIYSSDSQYKIVYYSNDWNMADFAIFKDKLVLSN